MLRGIKKGTNLQTISIHKSVPCRQDSLAWLPLTVNIFNYFLLISLLPLPVSSNKATHNFSSSPLPVPALLFPTGFTRHIMPIPINIPYPIYQFLRINISWLLESISGFINHFFQEIFFSCPLHTIIGRVQCLSRI